MLNSYPLFVFIKKTKRYACARKRGGIF